MTPTRQLAVIIGPEGSVAVQEVEKPRPGHGEILVKVIAAAQNPADWKGARLLAPVGSTAGCDFAGIVEEIGPDVPEGLSYVGERVAGFVHGGMITNGAFSEYLVASAYYGNVHLPDNWSFEHGAQLGIAPFTAIQMLYESHNIPFPEPHHWSAKPLLVSGAASSVGLWVVQLAALSGFYVVATASERNFELVKSFGADEVFDYKDPDVVQKIRLSTKGALKLAADTICENGSPELVFGALSDEGGTIAAISPTYPTAPRDGITANTSVVYDLLGEDYGYFGARRISTPENKERSLRFSRLLQELLDTGKLKPNPVMLFPKGLASVADGFQYMKEGNVSAQKITYRISDTLKE